MTEWMWSRRLWNRWGWRLLLAQWLTLLGVMTVFRAAFFWLYRSGFAEASVGEILVGFLNGARFDLSVIFAFTGIPGLIFLALSPLGIRRWLFWILFAYVALAGGMMFVLAGIDLFYYSFVNRRLSFEVFIVFKDWRPIAVMIGEAYLFRTVGILLALGVVLLLAVRGFGRVARRPWRNIPWWSHLGQLALLFVAIVFLVRGGLQTKPLSVGMAFRGANMAVGHLALNPVFTTVSALYRKNLRKLDYYPEGQALRTTRALLGMEGAPERPDYPLLRRREAAGGGTRKNLVFITLESFSAQFTGVLGGTKGVTDRFDGLAEEGMLFSNFFASGTRSLEGIASILTGFPALPTGTLIGSTLEQNKVRSLPIILKEQGYHSFFLHGAFRGSMWFDDFANRHGFERYIAKEDFPDAEAISDSTWGVFDQFSLERLHAELESSAAPVLAFYFSVSSHTPFELPEERFRKFGPDTDNADLFNSVAYTDYALGRFFDLARKSSYWSDTIFIITADHNMGGPDLSHLGRMWIPLLILNPGEPDFPRGVIDPTLGSQVDIAQTALDLLDIGADHTFAGNSLLKPAAHRFAMLGWGGQAGWLRPGSLLIHDTEKPLALYRYGEKAKAVPAQPTPVSPSPSWPSVVEFQSYLQTLNNLLVENRLSP